MEATTPVAITTAAEIAATGRKAAAAVRQAAGRAVASTPARA